MIYLPKINQYQPGTHVAKTSHSTSYSKTRKNSKVKYISRHRISRSSRVGDWMNKSDGLQASSINLLTHECVSWWHISLKNTAVKTVCSRPVNYVYSRVNGYVHALVCLSKCVHVTLSVMFAAYLCRRRIWTICVRTEPPEGPGTRAHIPPPPGHKHHVPLWSVMPTTVSPESGQNGANLSTHCSSRSSLHTMQNEMRPK